MIKKLSLNKLILVVLFLLWLFSFLYFSEYGFFSVIKKQEINNNKSSKLLKGEKLIGEINSEFANLAIIKLKFQDVNKVDFEKQDNLEFRLKEKGSSVWLVTNNYKSGLLVNNLNYPIGFSPIQDSKNKQFTFELESKNGNKNNFVTLSSDDNLDLVYFFNKSNVSSSIPNILNFLKIKLLTSFTSAEQLFNSLVYAVPLISFILYLFLKKNNKLQTPLFLLSCSFLFLDILIVNNINYVLSIITFILFIANILRFKGYKLNIFLFIFLIILWLFLDLLNIDKFNSKLNLWLYLTLILITISLYVLEFKQKIKNKGFTYKNIYEDSTQVFRFKLYDYLKLDKIFKNIKLLDLGCGYGPDAINFSKYAKEIVGLDIFQHAEWKNIENKKIKFAVGDSSKMSFKNNEFDAVFLKDLLHHVENVEMTLSEINRVTKAKGKMVIVEGNRYNPLFYIYVTKLKGHEHFTQKEFRDLIEKNFEEYDIYAYNIYPPFFLSGKIYHIFLNLILKTNRLKFLKRLFSYNIAVITKV